MLEDNLTTADKATLMRVRKSLGIWSDGEYLTHLTETDESTIQIRVTKSGTHREEIRELPIPEFEHYIRDLHTLGFKQNIKEHPELEHMEIPKTYAESLEAMVEASEEVSAPTSLFEDLTNLFKR